MKTKKQQSDLQLTSTAFYEEWDKQLLTPENIKVLLSSSKTKKVEESVSTTATSPTGIKTTKTKVSSSKATSPKATSNSTERWAGAAFSNSPAPSSLPIPTFAKTKEDPSLDDHSNLPPSPPTHDLNALSNHLKSMLNISIKS